MIFSETLINALGWTLFHALWQGMLLLLPFLLSKTLTQNPHRQYAVLSWGLACLPLLSLATFIYYLNTPQSALSPVVDSTLLLTPIAHSVPFASLEVYFPLAVQIWCAGAILSMLRIAGGWFVAQRLIESDASDAPPFLVKRFETLKAHLNLSQEVILRLSYRTQIPMVIGHLKPVVLLPFSVASGLRSEEVEAILLHELGHVQRNDYLINLLQTLVESLYFFHPMVWWFSSQIREVREHCCDDIAVSATGRPLDLAKALTHLQEVHMSIPTLAMAAKDGSLMGRIKRLMQPTQNQTRAGRLTVALLLCLGLTTLAATSAMFDDAPPKPPKAAAAAPAAEAPPVPEPNMAPRPVKPSAPAVEPKPESAPEPASAPSPVSAPEPTSMPVPEPAPVKPVPPVRAQDPKAPKPEHDFEVNTERQQVLHKELLQLKAKLDSQRDSFTKNPSPELRQQILALETAMRTRMAEVESATMELARQNEDLVERMAMHESRRAELEAQAHEAMEHQREAMERQREAMERQHEEQMHQHEAFERQHEAQMAQNEALERQQEELTRQQEEIERQEEARMHQQEEIERQREMHMRQQEEVERHYEDQMRQNEELQRQSEEFERQAEEMARQSEEMARLSEEIRAKQEAGELSDAQQRQLDAKRAKLEESRASLNVKRHQMEAKHEAMAAQADAIMEQRQQLKEARKAIAKERKNMDKERAKVEKMKQKAKDKAKNKAKDKINPAEEN